MPPGRGGANAKVSNPGITEIFTKFNCNYCQDEINGLRVSCAHCTDFDLCPECFACGAEIGSHKNSHKYFFSNNGNFSIFPKSPCQEDKGRRRASLVQEQDQGKQAEEWNVREDLLLLDAVEMFGYGNWKDIARHVESKNEQQVKERYIKRFINGAIGIHTWKEDLRGAATDHTQPADRGPLSPTLTGKLPPINVAPQESLLLGYMPHRDDFEDFDKSIEGLVSQIGDKSVEDEDVDLALKLAHVDIYERALREEVRRKRVARDYQLVQQYFTENPLIPFGVKISPLKMASLVKMKKNGSGGPKQELRDALKPFCQFATCREYSSLVDNLCYEKELKVRIRELVKYREHGLMDSRHLVAFERARFRREIRQRGKRKEKFGRLLPKATDYSLAALLNPEQDSSASGRAVRGAGKKKGKAVWSRKKLKTGRRLLLSMGCTLTAPASDPGSEEDG